MSIAKKIIRLLREGEPVPVDYVARATIEGYRMEVLEELAELPPDTDQYEMFSEE